MGADRSVASARERLGRRFDRRRRFARDDRLLDLRQPLSRSVRSGSVAPQVRGDPVLDAIFAVVTEGLVLLDASGTVVRWNAAAAEITGIPAERALGHSFAALLPVEGDVLRDATTPYAISLRRPPDDRLIRATVCSIAHAGEKRLLLALGPERRYAEIERLKDRLVGTLSHELKTPLAAIKA